MRLLKDFILNSPPQSLERLILVILLATPFVFIFVYMIRNKNKIVVDTSAQKEINAVKATNVKGKTVKQNKDVGFIFLILVGLFSIIFSGIVIIQAVNSYQNQARIKNNGRYTIGTMGSVTKMGSVGGKIKRTRVTQMIEYDGYVGEVTNDRWIPDGTRIPVLYLTEKPSKAIFGRVSDRISNLRGGKVKLFLLYFFVALPFLLLGKYGLNCFREALSVRKEQSKTHATGDLVKQDNKKIKQIIINTIIIILVIVYMIFFCPVPGKSEGHRASNEGSFDERGFYEMGNIFTDSFANDYSRGYILYCIS